MDIGQIDGQKLEALVIESVETQPIERQRELRDALRRGEAQLWDSDRAGWHYVVVGDEAILHLHWTRIAKEPC